MANFNENAHSVPSIVNDGFLMGSTGNKNPAELILSTDGKQVKGIIVETDLTSQRNKTGSVKLKINTVTGKVDVEVFDAAGQFLGRANTDLTVNGEKIPEIAYERRYSVEDIYSDADAVSDEERKNLKAIVDIEVGGRLKELREAHGKTQTEMPRLFPMTVPEDGTAYNKWERGTHSIPIQFLREVAEKWHVDLNWLILGTPMVMPTLPPDVADAISTLGQFRQDCLNGR